MAYVLTDDAHLRDVADVIRACNGTSDTYRPSEMAAAIRALTPGDGLPGLVDAMAAGTVSAYLGGSISGSSALIPSAKFSGFSLITGAEFPMCSAIGQSAFQNCPSLASVSFPACTSVSSYAFMSCASLSDVSLPACESIGVNVFNLCTSLSSATLPACTTVGSYAFQACTSLLSVALPACRSMSGSVFKACSSLASLDLTGVLSVPSILSTTFSGSPAGMSIYVPSSLYDAFVAASNWSAVSSRIVGV